MLQVVYTQFHIRIFKNECDASSVEKSTIITVHLTKAKARKSTYYFLNTRKHKFVCNSREHKFVRNFKNTVDGLLSYLQLESCSHSKIDQPYCYLVHSFFFFMSFVIELT